MFTATCQKVRTAQAQVACLWTLGTKLGISDVKLIGITAYALIGSSALDYTQCTAVDMCGKTSFLRSAALL